MHMFIHFPLSVLNVTVDVGYTPPPDFVSGPNDYRAASTVTLTCQVTGVSGTVSYEWTPTLPTDEGQSNTRRYDTLSSTESGTHTCTVRESSNGLTGSATIEINVVGE